MRDNPLIIIVGVCASGKTTLSRGLRALGYNARSVAQEHSTTPRLWERRNPDILIVLDCDFQTTQQRKPISWGEERFQAQRSILSYARDHADFFISTDHFRPEELVNHVDGLLREMGVVPV